MRGVTGLWELAFTPLQSKTCGRNAASWKLGPMQILWMQMKPLIGALWNQRGDAWRKMDPLWSGSGGIKTEAHLIEESSPACFQTWNGHTIQAVVYYLLIWEKLLERYESCGWEGRIMGQTWCFLSTFPSHIQWWAFDSVPETTGTLFSNHAPIRRDQAGLPLTSWCGSGTWAWEPLPSGPASQQRDWHLLIPRAGLHIWVLRIPAGLGGPEEQFAGM